MLDFTSIKSDIVSLINTRNCAPILVRLAWHDAGTYCSETKTGGPKATMRFKPVQSYDANNGLHIARNFLEPIKEKYSAISYADLWSLAGALAIHVTSNGKVPLVWRAGRVDSDESYVTPDGRLPDATLGQDHLRTIFYRMGLNDIDIVALSGAHTLGRFHGDRSGFEGPWTSSPLVFDNSYFIDLLKGTWEQQVNKHGNTQFNDKEKGTVMSPTDMCLLADPIFKGLVEKYAADELCFFRDFASSFQKLLELGLDTTLLTQVSLL